MDSDSDPVLGPYVPPRIVDYGTIVQLTASTGPPSVNDGPIPAPTDGPPPNSGAGEVS